MVGNKTINIGLVAEDVNTDYTKDLIYSIYDAVPEDRDIRIFVIAGKVYDKSDEDEIVRFGKQMYNSVYDFIGHCRLDGLIIALGSLRSLETDEERRAFDEKFFDTPRVYISAEIGDGVEVKFDNEMGIHEVVDVLINTDNISKLGMLGGREDNFDVVERREIFKNYLIKKGLEFPDSAYVATDMSINCREEAGELLDKNPGLEAIFCVNDAVAVGLYEAMAERNLEPGRDIKVFGFDNTKMAGEMSPPLSSIGPAGKTVGKQALELLIDRIDGREISTVKVPTRLYSRASLNYELYELASLDVTSLDEAGINRLFNYCFYRYRNATYRRENIDLQRLYYEFISRMISALKKRFMSDEEFAEVIRMVDIFIDNGAMEFTDTQRLMISIERMQAAINIREKSVSTNMMVNRAFLRIKDRVILAMAQQKEQQARQTAENQERLKRFLSSGMYQVSSDDDMAEISIRMLGSLGIKNLALFMYREPVLYKTWMGKNDFPDELDLRCIIKDGELYIPVAERQSGSMEGIFSREELPKKCRGYMVYPVFCGSQIYGLLACGLTEDIFSMGEMVSAELGRTLYMSTIRK